MLTEPGRLGSSLRYLQTRTFTVRCGLVILFLIEDRGHETSVPASGYLHHHGGPAAHAVVERIQLNASSLVYERSYACRRATSRAIRRWNGTLDA